MNDKSRPAISGDSDGVVAGRYRLIRLLGEGERKRTYLAEDTIVGRQVALAMVKPDALHSDPRGTAREVAAICQTGNHDNVVTLYDRGTADGSDYLVFEYLSGGNLREHLAQRRRNHESITPEELRRLGRQLARALSHVHARGLLHRDVAPANIWLDERHVAHLGDFDSAMPLNAPPGIEAPATTEAYASPEQVAGKPVDERSDLYSLGAVLYEALTGERPRRTGKGAIVAPRVLRPDAPPDLNALICRLLAPQPEDRPASAEMVLVDLKPPFATRRFEGLFPWADGLPFPLASILWLYDAEQDQRLRVDRLLNYFEALAAFTATVLLSGFRRDFALFESCKQAASSSNRGSDPIQLNRATFGAWVELSDRLSRLAREMLATQEGAERCFTLFAAEDRDLIDALVSIELTAILKAARDHRNAMAHGGIVGRHAQEEQLRTMRRLLAGTQELLATSFETWTLIWPGSATYSDGVFDLTATFLTGTNPVFRKARVQRREPLDARRLYLLNGTNDQALELVPFIQMMAGPRTGEDICFLQPYQSGRLCKMGFLPLRYRPGNCHR